MKRLEGQGEEGGDGAAMEDVVDAGGDDGDAGGEVAGGELEGVEGGWGGGDVHDVVLHASRWVGKMVYNRAR